MAVNRMQQYPLGSRERYRERNMAAMWTGERRAPKAGEWYLSGAVIEAYQAPNDLSQEFHIAKLVAARRRKSP